jgi:hypothetical protein
MHSMNIAPDHENASSFQIILSSRWEKLVSHFDGSYISYGQLVAILLSHWGGREGLDHR